MTCEEITSLMVGNRWRQTFTIPRFTPHEWWEADISEVTKAGYLREYEIKTSRSDFLRDGKKKQWRSGRTKHQLLAEHDVRGPVQFWFVAPEGLLKLNEIPAWAGLIEIIKAANGNLMEVERITAPRLHGERASNKTMRQLQAVAYWRYQGMLHLKATAKKHVALLRAFGWPKVKPKAA
jgi:hypothetical protein